MFREWWAKNLKEQQGESVGLHGLGRVCRSCEGDSPYGRKVESPVINTY